MRSSLWIYGHLEQITYYRTRAQHIVCCNMQMRHTHKHVRKRREPLEDDDVCNVCAFGKMTGACKMYCTWTVWVDVRQICIMARLKGQHLPPGSVTSQPNVSTADRAPSANFTLRCDECVRDEAKPAQMRKCKTRCGVLRRCLWIIVIAFSALSRGQEYNDYGWRG